MARVAGLDGPSMTIAQFFILSPRGDCIISKDFRGDEHPTMHEDFFRKVWCSSGVK